jgi:hypothetical protein
VTLTGRTKEQAFITTSQHNQKMERSTYQFSIHRKK